jgi:hypothetical protein
MELTKICTGCKEEKTLDNFYNHKTAKYNKNSKCKVCKNQMNLDYCRTDAHKQYRSKYGKLNRDKKNGYNSVWLKKASEELHDFYIRRQLQKMLKIPKESIPQELVELKRIQIKTHRLCQQLQN